MDFENYEKYLLSDKWEEIKKEFRNSKRYTNTCYLCYKISKNLQCHHWRYEKDWNKDNMGNLIQLCATCHETVHHLKTDKLMHNSSLYRQNELPLYLSHLIKALKLMDLAYIERLSNEFNGSA